MTDTNSAGTNLDVVDILTMDHREMVGLIEAITEQGWISSYSR